MRSPLVRSCLKGTHVAAGRITGNACKNETGDGWYYQISVPASMAPDGRRRQPRTRGPRRGIPFPIRRDALEAMDKRSGAHVTAQPRHLRSSR
jgi:hypothetical protein